MFCGRIPVFKMQMRTTGGTGISTIGNGIPLAKSQLIVRQVFIDLKRLFGILNPSYHFCYFAVKFL